MQLSPSKFNETYKKFHDSWNLARIQQMTLAEYADLSNHDSLCYWTEYGTKDLGAIGAIPLQKFEIWQPKNKEKDYQKFLKGDGYTWRKSRGETATIAFENIKKAIIQIVRYSMEGKWDEIEAIDFHSIGKWKFAFLFSDKQLLPIYSRRALLEIAHGIGYRGHPYAPIISLHQYILAQKPPGEDMGDYAGRLYSLYASKGKPKRNYFIIGSKYEGKYDMMGEFLQHGCVATGWLDKTSFTPLMHAAKNKIADYVAEHYEPGLTTESKLRGYFQKLSIMKPGDIVAVKSRGNFGETVIVAYAVVTERNGQVYVHHPGTLGHCINVEFLETNLSTSFSVSYAHTIHQLDPLKDEAFYDIFHWYAEGPSTDGEDDDTDGAISGSDTSSFDGNYIPKDETEFERSAIAKTIVRKMHSKIQNRFVQFLKDKYPGHLCDGEKQYIDAIRITPEEMWLYEIKPYSSPHKCLKEGIGQLLDYLHRQNNDTKKHIAIVGPERPRQAIDLIFLNSLKEALNVPIYYIRFDHANAEMEVF